jgi:hypothetical protein
MLIQNLRLPAGVAVGVALLFISSFGYCDDDVELIGDRPDFTESNATIPTGHLQAELGMEVGGGDEVSEIGLPRLLLRYGVLDSLELRLEAPDAIWTRPAGGELKSGAGAVALGGKWVMPMGDRAATGLIFMIGLPVTEEDFDAQGLVATLNAVSGIDLAGGFSLGSNLVLEAAGIGSGDNNSNLVYTLTGSLALGYAITDQWGVFAETFSSLTDDWDYTPFADAGLTYLLTPRVQFDIYGGSDVSDPTGGWFAGSGAIVLF